MKRLHFKRATRLSGLHDELIAAGLTPSLVLGDDDNVWLTYEDDVDDNAVEAIVTVHDATPLPPPPDPDDAFMKAIESATTLEQLKAALLGLKRK